MAKMRSLNAIISGGKDQFASWIEEVPYIYGAGDTVEETKKDLLEGLKLYLEENEETPEIFKGDYEIKFSFDTSGFLKYYSKYISFAGMKEITGINQKQLWNYAHGYKNPNRETSEKIFKSIKSFADEMKSVEFSF